MTDHPPARSLKDALDVAERLAESLQTRLNGTQGILDAISEAIYIQDVDGRFLDVNEGAMRMYGHPRDFFIGKTSEILSAPGRNDLGAVAQAFNKSFLGESQHAGIPSPGPV